MSVITTITCLKLICHLQNTPSEWKNVFYVCAGFAVTGMIIFNIFASGEMQVGLTFGLVLLSQFCLCKLLKKAFHVRPCVKIETLLRNMNLLWFMSCYYGFLL